MKNDNEATTKVEQIQQLMFNGLTRKQAAIVTTFEDHEDETYAEIARIASNVLPEDVTVTPEYVSAQLHERFENRLDENNEEETIEVSADQFNQLVNTVEQLADETVAPSV